MPSSFPRPHLGGSAARPPVGNGTNASTTALRKLQPSYRRSIEAYSTKTPRLHVVPTHRPTHCLDTRRIDVVPPHWHPQQPKTRQSLDAPELCVAPSIRRAVKSCTCADAACYSCHTLPGGTVRRHPRCRCADSTSRMARHFTIPFCIVSANARE